MRILFDGFWWVDGPVSNKQVMREFILGWERSFPDDELIIAVPRANVAEVVAQVPSRVEVVGTRVPQQGISAIVELPFVARRVHADRILTHNFTPLFGRSAVFVHDLMFVTHPEWFTVPERGYFSLMPLTIGRARWILSSSQSEADRVTELTRRHPAVTAVGLGLSRGLSEAAPIRPAGIDGIEHFLLAVGRINARKNLATSIEAAVESGVATPGTPLLVVGEPEGKKAAFGAAATAAIESGAVRFLGFIDDDELAWLYAHARVFVFLSLDEGFGMPTLEAAHFGAPVVASDIPVFREILGDRAAYVAPLDVAAAASAIRAAFEGGRQQPVDVESLGYSWDLSAQRIRQAIAGSDPRRRRD